MISCPRRSCLACGIGPPSSPRLPALGGGFVLGKRKIPRRKTGDRKGDVLGGSGLDQTGPANVLRSLVLIGYLIPRVERLEIDLVRVRFPAAKDAIEPSDVPIRPVYVCLALAHLSSPIRLDSIWTLSLCSVLRVAGGTGHALAIPGFHVHPDLGLTIGTGGYLPIFPIPRSVPDHPIPDFDVHRSSHILI